MKRYLIWIACLFLGAVAVYFAWNQAYLPKGKASAVTSNFYTEKADIVRAGSQERFVVKGVEVDSFLPGYYDTDYAVDKATYKTWFEQIAAMNANTIRANNIYDPDFYNALYEFNATRNANGQTPLYLIQVVPVTDYAQNSADNAWSNAFYNALLRNAKRCVDVVHGREFLPYAKTSGHGVYTSDVSPWVLAFEIGSRWEPDTIAYTDHHSKLPGPYAGKYVRTSEDASPFEWLLAKVMDRLCQYESDKYGQQHLIAPTTQLNTDPFDFETLYKAQIQKSATIDFQHFEAGPKLKGGMLVAYNYADYGHDFTNDLTAGEKERLAPLLALVDERPRADRYLALLEAYYQKPVVLVNCGDSSARGTTKGGASHSEAEQGEAIVRLYTNALDSGLSGIVLSAWQDNWSRTDWNTSPYTKDEQQPFWHDIQTEAQGFGLMAFKPLGVNGPVWIDGQETEWTASEKVFENKIGTLFAQFDAEGVYFKINWNPDVQFPVTIPLDVTPNSGASQTEDGALSFARDADFLLVFESPTEARLLVHSYYDSARAAWNQNIRGQDAYSIQVPEAHEPKFGPIEAILADPIVDDANALRNFSLTEEAGKLVEGRDLATANGCTEIRLPWQLLNFSAPNQAVVHDDYYLRYGIESLPVGKLYVGMGNATHPDIHLYAIKLPRWTRNFAYEERLKASYAIVQEAWKEGE